jgi:hypothetical protein
MAISAWVIPKAEALSTSARWASVGTYSAGILRFQSLNQGQRRLGWKETSVNEQVGRTITSILVRQAIFYKSSTIVTISPNRTSRKLSPNKSGVKAAPSCEKATRTLSGAEKDICNFATRISHVWWLNANAVRDRPARRLVRRQADVLAEPLRDEGSRNVATKFYSACS